MGTDRSRPKNMTVITIAVGADYTAELKKRLREADISFGELSRESGIAMPQLSRWFNTDIQPSLKNVARIEESILKIQRRRNGKGKKK